MKKTNKIRFEEEINSFFLLDFKIVFPFPLLFLHFLLPLIHSFFTSLRRIPKNDQKSTKRTALTIPESDFNPKTF